MKKYGFIYIWYDSKRKMYYIGSHWGTESDNYICSSRTMRKAYRRRPETFCRRVLKRIYTNRIDLLKEEQRWLDRIRPEKFGARYYNINSKANSWCWWMNENTKKIVGKKISLHHKNDPNYGSWMKGFQHTKESKEKIRSATKQQWENGMHTKNSLKGENRTEVQKVTAKHHSQVMMGRISPNKGKKHPYKPRPKAIGRKVWNKGLTKEICPKLSNSGVKKGNIPWNKRLRII